MRNSNNERKGRGNAYRLKEIDHSLPVTLRAAHYRATGAADLLLKRRGITVAQLLVLQAVRALNHGEASITAVARVLRANGASIAQTIRHLTRETQETEPLLRLETGPDRRTQVVFLTTRGKRKVDAADDDCRVVQRALRGALEPGEATVLLGLLAKFDTNLAILEEALKRECAPKAGFRRPSAAKPTEPIDYRSAWRGIVTMKPKSTN